MQHEYYVEKMCLGESTSRSDCNKIEETKKHGEQMSENTLSKATVFTVHGMKHAEIRVQPELKLTKICKINELYMSAVTVTQADCS